MTKKKNILKSISSDPRYWGRQIWNTLEVIACTMKEENRKYIICFVNDLQYLLPCETCANHYKEYLKNYPIQEHVKNPLQMLQWIYQLQTLIKKRQDRTMESFEDYLDKVIEMFDVPEIYHYYDLDKMKKSETWYDLDSINLIDILPT